MVWFTSDTHFCHNKSFIYEARGFSSIEEHDVEVVKRWNSRVNPEDDVYHLGDVILNDNEKGWQLLNQLNGNIYIIGGNHDTLTRIELFKTKYHFCGTSCIQKIDKYRLFLCHYPTATFNYDSNRPLKTQLLSLCGHTHSTTPWEFTGSYNVGLDAHNCYPVSFEEIINAFKERKKSYEKNED